MSLSGNKPPGRVPQRAEEQLDATKTSQLSPGIAPFSPSCTITKYTASALGGLGPSDAAQTHKNHT